MVHEDLELFHHGVLGMKWGVRNSETIARYKRNRAAAKQRRTAKRKARYAKSPQKAYKHRKMYSNKEMDYLIDRFGKEKKLKDFATDDLKQGKSFLERTSIAAKNAGAIADTASKYADLYNKFQGNSLKGLTMNDLRKLDAAKMDQETLKYYRDMANAYDRINTVNNNNKR